MLHVRRVKHDDKPNELRIDNANDSQKVKFWFEVVKVTKSSVTINLLYYAKFEKFLTGFVPRVTYYYKLGKNDKPKGLKVDCFNNVKLKDIRLPNALKQILLEQFSLKNKKRLVVIQNINEVLR